MRLNMFCFLSRKKLSADVKVNRLEMRFPDDAQQRDKSNIVTQFSIDQLEGVCLSQLISKILEAELKLSNRRQQKFNFNKKTFVLSHNLYEKIMERTKEKEQK